MFVEFTLLDDTKVSFNLNNIKAVYMEEEHTVIYCAYIPLPFNVKESYYEVMKTINNVKK